MMDGRMIGGLMMDGRIDDGWADGCWAVINEIILGIRFVFNLCLLDE